MSGHVDQNTQTESVALINLRISDANIEAPLKRFEWRTHPRKNCVHLSRCIAGKFLGNQRMASYNSNQGLCDCCLTIYHVRSFLAVHHHCYVRDQREGLRKLKATTIDVEVAFAVLGVA